MKFISILFFRCLLALFFFIENYFRCSRRRMLFIVPRRECVTATGEPWGWGTHWRPPLLNASPFVEPQLRIPFPCLKLCILQFCARANNILFLKLKNFYFAIDSEVFDLFPCFRLLASLFFRNKLLCCERGQHEMPIAAVSLPLIFGVDLPIGNFSPSASDKKLFNFFPLFRYFAEFMKVFSLFLSTGRHVCFVV